MADCGSGICENTGESAACAMIVVALAFASMGGNTANARKQVDPIAASIVGALDAVRGYK